MHIRMSEFQMKVGPPMRNPFLANLGLEIFHINEWGPAYLIQLLKTPHICIISAYQA